MTLYAVSAQLDFVIEALGGHDMAIERARHRLYEAVVYHSDFAALTAHRLTRAGLIPQGWADEVPIGAYDGLTVNERLGHAAATLRQTKEGSS